MNALRIIIRDFRRVERADIQVAPIALVAGLNAAGKTSIVQAVQAALLRRPLTTPEALVKTARALVRRGAEEASAVVSRRDGDGYAMVSWPACKVDSSDDDAPRSSEIAAGLVSILDMPPKDRPRALAAYVGAGPETEEIRSELAECGYSDEAVQQVLDAIEKNGWDDTHKKAVEAGANFKGRWEQITGASFGSSKSATWVPEGWDLAALEAADHQSLQMDEVDARSALERLIAAGAVGAAEVARLRDQMNTALGTDLVARQEAVAEIEQRLASLRDERAAMPAATGDGGMPCPSCGTHLVLMKDHTDPAAASLKVADSNVKPDELKRRRLRAAEIDGQISRAEGDLRAALAALRNAEGVVQAGEEAKAKLAEIEKEDADEAALAEARAAVAAAQARRVGYEAWVAARKVYANWQKNARLIDLLGPEGLRKRVLARHIETLNTRLAAASADAKWGTVRIDENFGAWCGTEPYWTLSKSTQWRVRTTLQVVLAQIDGSDLVVIDEADILDPKGRNGLVMMLKRAGVGALVAMTVGDRSKVPDLAAAGFGASYWLDGGIAASISGDRQEAA